MHTKEASCSRRTTSTSSILSRNACAAPALRSPSLRQARGCRAWPRASVAYSGLRLDPQAPLLSRRFSKKERATHLKRDRASSRARRFRWRRVGSRRRSWSMQNHFPRRRRRPKKETSQSKPRRRRGRRRSSMTNKLKRESSRALRFGRSRGRRPSWERRMLSSTTNS